MWSPTALLFRAASTTTLCREDSLWAVDADDACLSGSCVCVRARFINESMSVDRYRGAAGRRAPDDPDSSDSHPRHRPWRAAQNQSQEELGETMRADSSMGLLRRSLEMVLDPKTGECCLGVSIGCGGPNRQACRSVQPEHPGLRCSHPSLFIHPNASPWGPRLHPWFRRGYKDNDILTRLL